MNINLTQSPERDTTIVTVEIANSALSRERKLFNTMRYEQKPDKLLHMLGDLAFRMQKGMVKA